MNAIFLDVDGVLNSEAFLRKLDAKHQALGHHESCECFRLERQIDRDAIARLNRLVAATSSKIVISSSWRLLMDPPELHRVLTAHGLVAEIIGETPDLPNERREQTPFEERVAFGGLDRIERGHEIDAWLRRNPGVDRFVILDDCSDMWMFKNRLVQTDCQTGLLDEHVDLAIRVMSWDGKTIPSPMNVMEPMDDLQDEMEPRMPIVSTRSNENEDTRRDFDGFDVDQELRRLRGALRDSQWRIAAELTANLDEHLCRGGSLPVAWLGPTCMQGHHEDRLQVSVEAAATMSEEDRQAAIDGYVAVAPQSVALPGSSAGIHCNHNSHLREGRCLETLTLERTTTLRPTHEDDYQRLMPALDTAAVFLGWRVYRSVSWCPTHVLAKKLVCAQCAQPCPTCVCIDGPCSDAVDAIVPVKGTIDFRF